MKDLSSVTYDISRLFVEDHQSLDADEVIMCEEIKGYLRSRNIVGLMRRVRELMGEHSESSSKLRFLLQVESFFSKNDSFGDPDAKAQAAYKSFTDAEALCAETNRLFILLENFQVAPANLRLYQEKDLELLKRRFKEDDLDELGSKIRLYNRVLRRAARQVEVILGDFKPFLDSIPRRLKFTSGATATTSRGRSQPHKKVKMTYSAPVLAMPYITALGQYFGYGAIHVEPLVKNRVVAVPKSWKTLRTIACEPDGVIPLQLAFDSYVKERLQLKLQIDLSDQRRNQELAEEASKGGKYATLDLSSASDTLCTNLVASLVPLEWYRFLYAVRSSEYEGRIGDLAVSGRYAKFSSMGNGATFTLETLIFASLALATGASMAHVYGDDIIVEADASEDVVTNLEISGFMVNRAKSHLTGTYHESCGKHYSCGDDITPFFIRREPRSKAEWSHLLNGVFRICNHPLRWDADWITERGVKLYSWAISQTAEKRLPVVPWTESSTRGVMTTPRAAYDAGLIRSRNWVQHVYGILPKFGKSRVCVGSRTLFLWYKDSFWSTESQALGSVRRTREGTYVTVEAKEEKTRIPSEPHNKRYKTGWAPWYPCAFPIPPAIWSGIDKIPQRVVEYCALRRYEIPKIPPLPKGRKARRKK